MKQALATALDSQGYTDLTAVQAAVTAPEVIGKDLLVSAQTGSGKTVGFGLAIAPTLLGEDETFGEAAAPLALVIAPTRELALQVKRELAWLFANAGAVLASTVGGMDMRDERRALGRGAHIVVATPGRLRDHIMRGSIDLSALRAVVLDEADEMLDLGFREDLEFILDQAPSTRQTLLFSATVPAAIAKLAQNYQKDAERIATVTANTQHADIEYRALNVSARDAENAIVNVLRYYEAPNAIVFCNTRAMVNRLTTRLSNRGFSVVALSGELSQSERTHALQAMRDGRARVCVATDVAARGIDLPNLELVIHAELPTNQDTLLHRSGRTGRAGRKGVSALIVPPAARKKAQRLLGWAKVRADWADAPSAEEVTAKDDARMLANSDWSTEVEAHSVEIVETLTATYSVEQLAAAYVRLYRERHSAPEDLSPSSSEASAAPREAFGPSTWFSLPGGREAGAEPRRLLPMLCKMGGLSREDIGAIRIQQDHSLVEVRQEAVSVLTQSLGASMLVEDGAVLTQLASPPSLERAPRPAKPAGPKTPYKDKAPYKDKTPRAPKAWDAAEPASRDGTTTPVDWNDAPAPKKKKPKPAEGAKPRAAKPQSGKPPFAKPQTDKPEWKKPEGKKPRHKKTEGAKPEGSTPGTTKWKPKAGAAGAPDAGPAGKTRKPPAGKPSSKKNRARQAAAVAAKSAAGKVRKPKA